MLKKTACLLLLLLFTAVTVHAQDIGVTVDGQYIQFADQQPIIENGRTLVPLRSVFEALGFTVEWHGEAQTAVLTRAGTEIRIAVDSDIFTLDGAEHMLDVPARNINSNLMLPVRALAEGIGYTVDWDDGTVILLTHAPAVWRVATLAGSGIHGYRDGHDPLFNLPASVFAHGAGMLVADTFNNLIRTVSPGGYTSLLAGAVLPPDEFDFPRGAYRSGTAPFFNRPTGGATCAEGRIFIADSQNNAIRVIIDGTTYTHAGGEESGHRDGEISTALFYRPMAVAFGPCGGLFVADTFNDAVRRISPDGYVTTVAQGFNMPMGIAVCPQGRIFVADTGNHLIRIIEDGQMRTLAGTLQFDEYNEPAGGFADGMQAMFNLPVGLSLLGEELLVADSANHAIRRVSATGNVQTVAGMGEPGYTNGYAYMAQFHFPRGVLAHGNRVYVADTGNNMLRVLYIIEGGVQ